MAYANDEDRAKLKANGWAQDDANMQFLREVGGMAYSICATWFGRKVGDLGAPPPDKVFWVAVATRLDNVAVTIVVTQDERCPSPIHCMVLAEVREWKTR